MAQTLFIQVKGDTRDLVNDLKRAENVTVRSGGRMTESLGGVERAYDAIKTAVVAYLGVQTIKSIIEIADTYSLLESRLKLVTSGAQELKEVQAALLVIANESRVAYEGTANLYARLGRSTEHLGTSTEDLLKVTETISKALIVSGATATEAENALIQLSQGMASGTLRGDELRSVLEQVPRVAKAIADGMGITVGQLREFGKAGKLTAEAVIPALISQLGKISKEFAQIDVTVGQSIAVLKNAFFSIIDEANNSSSATDSISESILELSATMTNNKEGIIDLFSSIVSGAGSAIEATALVSKELLIMTSQIGGLVSISEQFGGPGALDMGIVGAVLFKGGKGAAAAALALVTLNSSLKTFDLNIGSLIPKYKGMSESIRNLIDVATGKRSGETGEIFTDLQRELNVLLSQEKQVISNLESMFLFDRKRSKGKLQGIQDEIAEIEKLIKQEKITINLEKVIAEGYKDRWMIHKSSIETIQQKNDALFKSVIRESQKTTKIRKDNWQIQLKDREKVIARMEKAQEQATKRELKVSEKAIADEMKLNAALAQSVEDGWLKRDEGAQDALDRLAKHGEEYFRGQVQIWEDLGGHTRQFFDDLQDTSSETYAEISGLFSTFTSDLIDGNFKNIGDAWDDLWKGALNKLADVVVEMAVTWAASAVGNLFEGWDIFHAGIWDLKDDEVPGILQKGEMVIPKAYAEIIRNEVGSGGFEGLAGLTGHIGTDVGAWDVSGSFGPDFENAIAREVAQGLFGVLTGTADPVSVATGIAGTGVASAVEAMTGYSPDPFGLGPGYEDGWSTAGGFLGGAATAYGVGGGPFGAFMGPVGKAIGSFLGDRVGDMLDDRSFEGVRDAFEAGIIGMTEARNFVKEAVRVDPEHSKAGTSTLGGIMDAIGGFIDGVVDAVKDAFGFTGPSEGGGGGRSEGFGDRESSPGGQGGVHGGMDFIPKETTYMLDKGERVLSPNQNADLTSFLRGSKKDGDNVTVNVMMNGRALNSIIEDVIVERSSSQIAPTGRLYGY